MTLCVCRSVINCPGLHSGGEEGLSRKQGSAAEGHFARPRRSLAALCSAWTTSSTPATSAELETSSLTPFHTGNHLFGLPPSGQRYGSHRTRTTRARVSFSKHRASWRCPSAQIPTASTTDAITFCPSHSSGT